MDFEIKHGGDKFYTIIDGLESHLQYMKKNNDVIIFYHTYVPPQLRGRGIAQKIIKAGMDYAVEKKLRVIPTCSAVAGFINRYPEYEKQTYH
jgi:hypothetical protein